MLKTKELDLIISIKNHTQDFNEFNRPIPIKILEKIFEDFRKIFNNQNLIVNNFIDSLDKIEQFGYIERRAKNIRDNSGAGGKLSQIRLYMKPKLCDFSKEEYERENEQNITSINAHNSNVSVNSNNIQQQITNNDTEMIAKFIEAVNRQNLPQEKKNSLIQWIKDNSCNLVQIGLGIASLL